MSLPSNWTYHALREVIEPSTNIDPRLYPKRLFTYIDIGSIDGPSGKIVDPKKVTGSGAPSRARRRVQTSDVLFSTVRTYLRKVVMVPATLDGQVASTGLAVLRAGPSLVPEYLFHWVRSKQFIDFISGAQTGALYPSVRETTLLNATIPVAPFPEQLRVAEALSTIFETTNIVRTRLEEASILVDEAKKNTLRLAFDGGLLTNPYKQDSIPPNASLPTSWRKGTFGDLAAVDSELVSPRDFPEAPHIAPNHIESGTGKLLPYRTIKDDGVKSAKNRFRPGQILYSKIRPQLRKAALVDFGGLCSADMYPLTARADAKFLLYWLLSPQFNEHVKRRDGRTVLPKINRADLLAIPTPIPPLAEQTAIAAAIERAFEQLERTHALIADAKASLQRLEDDASYKAFSGQLVRNIPNEPPVSLAPQTVSSIDKIPSKIALRSDIEEKTMAGPQQQLTSDIIEWPERGLTFAEISERISGDYEDIREAIFSALTGNDPVLEQVFDSELGMIRLKRRTA